MMTIKLFMSFPRLQQDEGNLCCLDACIGYRLRRLQRGIYVVISCNRQTRNS